MTPTCEVLLAGAIAGHLVELAPGDWEFIYAEQATDNLATPLGVALPRSRAMHRGEVVRHFFANLLPDGALRGRLYRSLGLSEGSELALLGRIGGETVGALSIRIPGERTRGQREERALSRAELRDLAAVLPLHPLLAEADGMRKTLPGEFDKLPVRARQGEIHLVLDDDLTTHVMKPAKPGLRETVINEAFCMDLAAAFGLPVAATEVVHGKVSLLAVARVDRAFAPESSDRASPVGAVHMEDLCQALGLAPERKYEREGGARLAEIATLLRAVSVTPARDLRLLVDWVVFSFLIGFGAAHAKQLALRHTADGPSLAPFFGLWSTHVYPEMSFRMGFALGSEDRPDWLSAPRWEDFARAVGVRPRYVLQRLRDAAETLPRLARERAEAFQRKHGYGAIIGAVRALLEQRARQALVALEATTNR